MKKIVLILPLLIVIIISIFLMIFLLQGKNPQKPPSALLNKSIPEFKLENLFPDQDDITNNNLKNQKLLINFFASWCIPCKAEHKFLVYIKNNFTNVRLVGIDHKDVKDEALKFLKDNENPYHDVGFDKDGMVSLEFGVFGLPETFITNNEGKIIYKHLGPITKDVLKNEIIPLLQ